MKISNCLPGLTAQQPALQSSSRSRQTSKYPFYRSLKNLERRTAAISQSCSGSDCSSLQLKIFIYSLTPIVDQCSAIVMDPNYTVYIHCFCPKTNWKCRHKENDDEVFFLLHSAVPLWLSLSQGWKKNFSFKNFLPNHGWNSRRQKKHFPFPYQWHKDASNHGSIHTNSSKGARHQFLSHFPTCWNKCGFKFPPSL